MKYQTTILALLFVTLFGLTLIFVVGDSGSNATFKSDLETDKSYASKTTMGVESTSSTSFSKDAAFRQIAKGSDESKTIKGQKQGITFDQFVGVFMPSGFRSSSSDIAAGFYRDVSRMHVEPRYAYLAAEALAKCRRLLEALPEVLAHENSIDVSLNEAEIDCRVLTSEVEYSESDLIEKAAAHGVVEAVVAQSSYPPNFNQGTDFTHRMERIKEWEELVLDRVTSLADQGNPAAQLEAGLLMLGRFKSQYNPEVARSYLLAFLDSQSGTHYEKQLASSALNQLPK